MTNPRDDLMALALEAYNKVWNGWPDPIDAANVGAVRFAAMKAALAASRPATQVVDREAVALLRKALQLIANRAMAAHASDGSEIDVLIDIETFARQALKDEAACSAKPVEAEGVGEPVALRHLGQVLYMLADLHEDDRCTAFDNALAFYNASGLPLVKPTAGYVTRLVQTGPLDSPKSPDISAEEMRDACELVAINEENENIRATNGAIGLAETAMRAARAFTASKIAAAIRQLPTERG